MGKFEEIQKIQEEIYLSDSVEGKLVIEKIEDLEKKLKTTRRKTFWGSLETTFSLLMTIYAQSSLFEYYPIHFEKDHFKFFLAAISGIATLLGLYSTTRNISKEAIIENKIEELEDLKNEIKRGKNG